MNKEIVILASFWILFLTWMLWQIKKAPEGYERDDKFHYGKEPINNENNKNE